MSWSPSEAPEAVLRDVMKMKRANECVVSVVSNICKHNVTYMHSRCTDDAVICCPYATQLGCAYDR